MGRAGTIGVIAFIVWWISTGIMVAIPAVWRITAYLYTDKGLLGEMKMLRGEIAKRGGWLVDQFSCFWCLSLWTGFLFSIPVVLLWPIFLPVALSGIAILLCHGGRTIWRHTEA